MEKDQIIIFKDRGLISVYGNDARDFLQNLITNDIFKVSQTKSIFTGIFTPQGKYLFEFFLIKNNKGYLIDCSEEFTKDLFNYLLKYKLRANVKLQELSTNYAIGIINYLKFKELQLEINSERDTIYYRESPIFIDPRNNFLGARIISPLEKLYLTIKKLNLKIIDTSFFNAKSHKLGIPQEGLSNLKEKLFGLEANFEDLGAIDFKKGCYIGQENTARMKLKNKLRKRLMSVETEQNLNIGDNLMFDDEIIGKVLINKPFPFALVNLYYSESKKLDYSKLFINGKKVDLISYKV